MNHKNDYREYLIGGEQIVLMTPNNLKGNVVEVIVPKKVWEEKLCNVNWGIQWERKDDTKIKLIQARIDGTIKPIHRAIYEYYHGKEQCYNRQIDHLNNNPLDNRLCNLRAVPSAINGINKAMRINKTSKGTFKVYITIGEDKYQKEFYNLEDAKEYQKEIEELRKKEIDTLLKYDRYAEFKRGLEDMIKHGEMFIVRKILSDKGIL
jgi:hypothetical protein